MTDTDICGAETSTDQPCQNPPTEGDSCWIESHGGDTEAGRPSKFNANRAADAIEAARDGMSKAGCARAAGVAKSTLHDWLEADYEYDGERFRNAFRRARASGEDKLIQGGLYDDDVDSSMAKFLLASSFEYKKTEKREVTGEGGGPVEIEVNETVVETGYDE